MPPKRKFKGLPSAPKRRSTRRKAVDDEDIPQVYRDMLAEAVVSEAAHTSPPKKRRKVDTTASEDVVSSPQRRQSTPLAEPAEDAPLPIELKRDDSKLQQLMLDDFSASSEEDEVEFEDVEFEDVEFERPELEAQDDEPVEQRSLQIDLSKLPQTPARALQRRKIATPAERALRLSVHKAHLLLLMVSISIRNRWCEDASVQAILKPLVSKKLIKQLHLDESEPQWKRSIAFNDSVKEICTMWRTTFQITERGLRRALWRSGIDISQELEGAEDVADIDDFKSAAQTRSGSRDLGAQLFCALLRACAVESRLVCSLQVLPFSAAAAQQTSEKARGRVDYAYAPSQDFGSSRSAASKQKFDESPYPMFWVEAFSPSISTWIPLDPLVRNTVNKPKTGFEPPASDQLNAMSYVIAFDEDASAKDVTRRYAQWFNAKTRKVRLEATKGGEQWYASLMRFFDKKLKEDRDVIEDAELAKRIAAEGMPKNIQDFLGHPLYVLERHLRRNEVLSPRREAGKVSIGVGLNRKLEPVFRRRDVHVCRSADAWYRRGRDVRTGETPLKRAVPKRREARAMSINGEDAEDESKALYAEFQTDLFIPQPVVEGRIPRNAFGNLDVYVPSMIPAGGIHVKHPLAVKAARVLGIDYAEAVTGFEFKGRQGTAVVDGVVVEAAQRIAMVTVVVGLQSQSTEEVEAQRSRVLLGIWKKWYTALKIKSQLERDYGPRNEESDVEEEDQTYQDEDAGGGFFGEEPAKSSEDRVEQGFAPLTLPRGKLLPDDLPPPPSCHEVVVVVSPHEMPHLVGATRKEDSGFEGANGDLFGDDDEDNAKGDMQLQAEEEHGADFALDHEEAGDGFIAEDADEDMGGGFLPEDEPDHPATPADAGSPLALDMSGGGFILDSIGFEADAETRITTDRGEVQVSDSGHVNRDSREPSSPSPDDAEQADMLKHAVLASSLDVAVHPKPIPPELSAGPMDLEHTAVAPDVPDKAVWPKSTQSSELKDEDEEDRMSHDPDEFEADNDWLQDSLEHDD